MTVIFNANNGTIANGNSKLTCFTTNDECDIKSFEIPTVERAGYIFKGWGTKNTCTSGKNKNILVSEDTTFYACWVEASQSNLDNDNNSGKEEIDDNPGTGSGLLYIIYILGVAALGYTGYYAYKTIKVKND